jgi:hypothetical protein
MAFRGRIEDRRGHAAWDANVERELHDPRVRRRAPANRLREGRRGSRRHGATIEDPADCATGVADGLARPGPVLIQPKGFEIARHAFGDKIREKV